MHTTWGKTKGGQPYPKRTKHEIKGLIKENIKKLNTKKIGNTKSLKVLRGERNAIYKDSKGNLLVIDPRDNRLGLVSVKGEYMDKETVLKFVRDNERHLRNKIAIKRGEIVLLRRIANQKEATANKVIREEHILLRKKIPESQIHAMLKDRHGDTGLEIIREEHRMMNEGIPEGKVHIALRKVYG